MENEQAKKPIWQDALQLGALALVSLLGWLLLHDAATTDSQPAVENALRLVCPADVESITVYPFGPGTTRPFQLRTATGIAPLLPALKQLVALAPNSPPLASQPLATLSVRLRPAAVAAWHLHGHELIFRLSASGDQGDVAQRAASPVVYQASALNQQVRHLRDSLSVR